MRSDASESGLPAKRTDPPDARLASMKSSIVSAVIAVTRIGPKNGTRWWFVNERWFSRVLAALAWSAGYLTSHSSATVANVGTSESRARIPRSPRV